MPRGNSFFNRPFSCCFKQEASPLFVLFFADETRRDDADDDNDNDKYNDNDNDDNDANNANNANDDEFSETSLPSSTNIQRLLLRKKNVFSNLVKIFVSHDFCGPRPIHLRKRVLQR